jgi:hypothetical protein
MILLNFGHPLTDEQLGSLREQTGQETQRVIMVRTQFEPGSPFAAQARGLVESAGLSTEEWQTTPLLVNLPSLNVIAALVLAELHGRMGYFPAVLRLRPVEGTAPPRFEVAEILNLQAVRDTARQRR